MGTFCVRKGNEFWDDFSSALIDLFPGMVKSITEQATLKAHSDVHSRSRILLIDDDPSIEEFFFSRLDKYEVDVLWAADAVQGYRTACREEPTIIVCNDRVPNGGASYLLWRLRTTVGTESIPVYVLSGCKLDEVTELNLKREICGRPGATRFFTKAPDTDGLFEALQENCRFRKR
jgi:CheY-like chemotaxis protein